MVFTTLVDAATLASHLDDPAWRIVDVRHQLADPQVDVEALLASPLVPAATTSPL